jgi:hypothetical protein
VTIAAAAISSVGFACRHGVGEVVIVSDGSVESNTTPAILEALEVYGTNVSGDRSTYNAGAPLTLTGDLRVHDAGIFNAEADVTCGGEVRAYWGGTINLKNGILSAPALNFDGPAAVTRSGGHYTTEALSLSADAAIGYGPDDSILYDVSLSTGASLILARDLSTAAHITIDGASTSLASAGHAITAGYLDIGNDAILSLDQNLSLSAGAIYLYSGGAIVRTTQIISAPSFFIENATLDLLAGDTFDPTETSTISGGIVNAPAGTALGLLNVYGTNDNGDRATFNVNGDVTVNGSASAYSDGVLNLIAGTLSTPHLSLTGVGSAGQSGGHYDVTSLSLSGGATLAFGIGDSIDSLFISDTGSRLDELAALTLTSLSLTNGGILHLGAFTGTGAIANWGLRMAGDDKTFLENLIFAGWITDGPSPLQVIFDPVSNMTYVTSTPGAVPEIDPNTALGAVMLLVGAAGILERRLRRVALARQAFSSSGSGILGANIPFAPRIPPCDLELLSGLPSASSLRSW